MIAIVDSGSTKTHWCFMNKAGECREVFTGGLNPFAVDSRAIRDCLEKDLYPFIDNSKVRHVFFFGSGCADAAKRTLLQGEFEDFFPKAEISIESDLLGASIALCGKKKGLVAILGTGAATCYYDGTNMAKRIASLGYVLGDEGSGARIGARFLSDYLREGMPERLRIGFAPFCPYSLHEVIDRVYHGDQVGRMLGEMALFASGRMEDDYVRQVLEEEFGAFFSRQMMPYAELLADNELNVLGSVAFHARDLLLEVASRFGIRIGKIAQSPMEGLVDYYSPLVDNLLRIASFESEEYN